MFEDITQMEKEIEVFRKNVVASSELVEGISELIEITKRQRAEFSDKTDKVLEKMNAGVQQMKKDHDTALQTLSNDNETAIANLQEKSSVALNNKIVAIEKIESSMESCLSETSMKSEQQLQRLADDGERLVQDLKNELSAMQVTFGEKLQKTEGTLADYQIDAEQKYNEFIRRLEMTNVDQIFKEVQDLKKSIETKFLLLMGSIVLVIVISVLGFFL